MMNEIQKEKQEKFGEMRHNVARSAEINETEQFCSSMLLLNALTAFNHWKGIK